MATRAAVSRGPATQAVGVSEAVIEVQDEGIDTLGKLVDALEAAATQDAANEHGEPALDGIEPAGVLGSKEEADRVSWVLQPCSAFEQGIQHLLIGKGEFAQRSDSMDHGQTHVGVELVQDHRYTLFPIDQEQSDEKMHNGRGILIGSLGRADAQDLSGADEHQRQQRQRPVARVLEFLTLRLSREHGLVRKDVLNGLNSGLLIEADHGMVFIGGLCNGVGQRRCDLLSAGVKLRVFGAIHPLLHAMRL